MTEGWGLFFFIFFYFSFMGGEHVFLDFFIFFREKGPADPFSKGGGQAIHSGSLHGGPPVGPDWMG